MEATGRDGDVGRACDCMAETVINVGLDEGSRRTAVISRCVASSQIRRNRDIVGIGAIVPNYEIGIDRPSRSYG